MLLSVLVIAVAASLVSAQDGNGEVVSPDVIGEPIRFFGTQDVVDIAVDSVPETVQTIVPLNNKTDKPWLRRIRRHLRIATRFVAGGNTISTLRDRNVTINENYLLAEHFWGPPTFERVDAVVDTTPRLAVSDIVFPFFPCKVFKYHCPVQWRYLWGFLWNHEMCYVPWPRWQLIRYATCICEYCLAPFQHGTCQESYYEIRNIWVVCRPKKKPAKFRWRYITMFLSTGCQCRTC